MFLYKIKYIKDEILNFANVKSHAKVVGNE